MRDKPDVMMSTPEQRLSNVRNLLGARLFVPPDEQRFLLSEYDNVLLQLRLSHEYVQRLEEELEDLKTSTRFLVESNDGDNGPSVD